MLRIWVNLNKLILYLSTQEEDFRMKDEDCQNLSLRMKMATLSLRKTHQFLSFVTFFPNQIYVNGYSLFQHNTQNNVIAKIWFYTRRRQ